MGEETMNGGLPMESHPYAFHVAGPRHLSSLNWRDLINSTWEDGNYKRTVMACFIQSAYLLELDRQENRTEKNALAPNWWLPFKYKLIEALTDERDGSIFGAILEWDRSSALADDILIRPSGAPNAVLALRGTLFKSMTIRRDFEDNLRFVAWESLKGSARFKIALQALQKIANQYGDENVCIAGHSLGAGFALQTGKLLAEQGIYVEAHLFNPPSISLRSIVEKAFFLLISVKAILPLGSETLLSTEEQNKDSNMGFNKWIPHLYVNYSDYFCCYYNPPKIGESSNNNSSKDNLATLNNTNVIAKLFILSKGNQKFLDAHRLDQWWADDLKLNTFINSSKLISRQLRSLYRLPATKQTLGKQR